MRMPRDGFGRRRNPVWPALGAAALSLALLFGLGMLSRLKHDTSPTDDALLRLSWRTRPGAASEVCRQRTPEELAALPAHMRAPQVCEPVALTYRIDIDIDGNAHTVTLRPTIGDRPVFVLHEVRLAPGPHVVDVRFAGTDPTRGVTDADAKHLRVSLVAEPREIHLITTNDAGALEHRTAAASTEP